MKVFKSACRNCICLHYYAKDSEDIPEHCYCPRIDPQHQRCTNYEPLDNLEYLEMKYSKLKESL